MNPIAKIIFKINNKIVTKYSLSNNTEIIIGSNKQQAQIVLKHLYVSRQHAKISIIGNRIFIEDLKSTNGTYINKKRISPGIKTEIKNSCIVNFGASQQVEVLVILSTNQVASQKPIDKKTSFTHNNTQKICIGRSSKCTIVLKSTMVSRQHAFISKINDKTYQIIDNNSTNGTYVNNQLITGEKTITGDDDIKIGEYRFTLNEYFDKKPIESKANKLDILSILNRKKEVYFGRSKKTDIVINDYSVSRKHAKIVKQNNRYYIIDLNSINGTYVNGKRIKSNKLFPIRETDEIRISLQSFKITGETTNLSEYSAIKAEGVSKTFSSNHYTAVKTITFSIPSKSFVALMGPSGCGKSTLMDMLNGSRPTTQGDVYIHGLNLKDNFDLLKQKIGYVPQDDIVHKNLIVDKALYYAAKLRMNTDTSKEEIYKRIDEVCNNLKITKEQRKNYVSKLSGGQRKRVSIALELLNKPSILFLDEPTSPLDPETIDSFLTSIKNLSHKEDTTVIMVTHKPEDLKYVDRVLFMGAKGFVAYYGAQSNLFSYFNVSNIIKIYAKLSNAGIAENFYNKWINKQDDEKLKTNSATVNKRQKISLLKQFFWLTVRYANLKKNDKQNLLLLILQPILIPLALVFIYERIELGILFLMAITSIWFGVSNAAKEIVDEIAIYKRERMYNLKLLPYIFSKITVLSVIALIQVSLYLIVLSLHYNVHSNNIHLVNIPTIFTFMFYLTFSATLLGLFLSVIFKTSEQVMSIIPIVLIPQIIFAGVVSQVDTKNKEVLSYFMYGRWGTEGMARIQSDNKDFKTYKYKPNDSIIVLQEGGDPDKIEYIKDLSDNRINDKPEYQSVYQKIPEVKILKKTYLIVNDDEVKGDELDMLVNNKKRKVAPINYITGKQKYEKVDPLKQLGYYNNKKLLNYFGSLKKNIFAISLLNILFFILSLYFLNRKDLK